MGSWWSGYWDPDAPLAQYLFRARYSGIADRAEELRGLRQKAETVVVPIQYNQPFRLYIGKKLLQTLQHSVGSPEQILRAIRNGLYISRVRYDPNTQQGELHGYTQQPSLGIQLVYPPFHARPETWMMTEFRDLPPFQRPSELLVKISAVWIQHNESPPPDVCPGDARALFETIRNHQEEFQEWLKAWHPPIISGESQVLHLSSTLRKKVPEAIEIFDLLCSHRKELHLLGIKGERWENNSVSLRTWYEQRITVPGKLRIIVSLPRHRQALILVPAPFAPADSGHWLLCSMTPNLSSGPILARLRIPWQAGSRNLRESHFPMDWLCEVADVLEQFEAHAKQWQIHSVGVGCYYRIALGETKLAKLHQLGWTLEKLLHKMNQGLYVCRILDPASCRIGVRFADGSGGLILQPQNQQNEPSDWKLRMVRPLKQTGQAFAVLRAPWYFADSKTPRSGADALRILAELDTLQKTQRAALAKFHQLAERLDHVEGLSERLKRWRKITDLERTLVEVGVASFQKADRVWLLTPAQEDRFLEWHEELEQLYPEGIPWDRHLLRLRWDEQELPLRIVDTQWRVRGEDSATWPHLSKEKASSSWLNLVILPKHRSLSNGRSRWNAILSFSTAGSFSYPKVNSEPSMRRWTCWGGVPNKNRHGDPGRNPPRWTNIPSSICNSF